MRDDRPSAKTTAEIIADSTVSLIAAQGYEAVTVKMITKEANVSRQTFYTYFSGKEDLLQHIFREDAGPAMQAMVENNFAAETSALLFRYLRRKSDFYRRVFRENGDLFYQSILSAYRAIAERSLEHGPPRGSRPSGVQPELFFRFYITALASVICYWMKNDMAVGEEQMAKDLNTLISHPMPVVWDFYLK